MSYKDLNNQNLNKQQQKPGQQQQQQQQKPGQQQQQRPGQPNQGRQEQRIPGGNEWNKDKFNKDKGGK